MGTFFHEGIEFVLPGILKAYPQNWANQLICDGTIYLTNLDVIRKDEHPKRGDPLEGVSVTIRNATRCTADYLNPIFVWCSTMETEPERILATWQDRDTVLQITNTLEFARRILQAAKKNPHIMGFHVGPVTYDKDEGSHTDYHWVEGIFQKGLLYNEQKEFRFALVGECDIQQEENVVLNIGSCTDIVRTVRPLCQNSCRLDRITP